MNFRRGERVLVGGGDHSDDDDESDTPTTLEQTRLAEREIPYGF